MATPYLILDLESAGLDADVTLNGVPIVEERSAQPVRRALKINGWIIDGDNLLEVRLKRQAQGTPRFGLTLRRANPGPSTSGDETLLEYTWSVATQPLSTGEFETVLTRHLSLTAPKSWSWVRAPALPQLGEEDRRSIISVLRDVERALAARNPEAVVTLQTLSLTEQAEAVGEDPAMILARYSEFLQQRMSQPTWSVVPFATDALVFVPLAGGRLFHIRTTDGRPPVSTTTADSRFQIDPYVAKLDGRWTIVR